MFDLYLAVAILAIVSAGVFVSAVKIGAHLPRLVGVALIVLLVVGIAVFVSRYSDHVMMARLLPFSNAVVLSALYLPLTALLCGIAWHTIPGSSVRRIGSLGLFMAVSFCMAMLPMVGAPPPMVNIWSGPVCMQTSDASCSAAAAATLLRHHGIQATEAEMAELCLTRSPGTSMLGLYRGLKLKTRGTAWDVEVFQGDPNVLQERTPAILSVGLGPAGTSDSRYAEKWGWTPGLKHSVVLFDVLPNGVLDVGDPAVGREQWLTKDLPILWHGTGMRLVPRR